MDPRREEEIRRTQNKVKMDMIEMERMVNLKEWGAVCITAYALMEVILFRALLRKWPNTSYRRIRKACPGLKHFEYAAYQEGLISDDTHIEIKFCARRRKYIHANSDRGMYSFDEQMARHAIETLSQVLLETERCDYTPVESPFRSKKTRRKPLARATRRVLRQFLHMPRLENPRVLAIRYM